MTTLVFEAMTIADLHDLVLQEFPEDLLGSYDSLFMYPNDGERGAYAKYLRSKTYALLEYDFIQNSDGLLESLSIEGFIFVVPAFILYSIKRLDISMGRRVIFNVNYFGAMGELAAARWESLTTGQRKTFRLLVDWLSESDNSSDLMKSWAAQAF